MGTNIYNSNEEKYSQIINSLKGLPRIKAPDNFEYKLMIKLENKDYSLNLEERTFSYSRRLIPAAALAVSAVVLFFVISDSSVNIENPLLKDPPVRHEITSQTADTIEISTSSVLAANPVTEENTPAVNNEQVVRMVVEPNDVVAVEKELPPFDDSKSLDLDNLVKGKINQTGSSRGVLVGGGQAAEFNGFLVRQRASEDVIKSHKARMDSLKNSKAKSR